MVKEKNCFVGFENFVQVELISLELVKIKLEVAIVKSKDLNFKKIIFYIFKVIYLKLCIYILSIE